VVVGIQALAAAGRDGAPADGDPVATAERLDGSDAGAGEPASPQVVPEAATAGPRRAPRYPVLRVVDGDTVVIAYRGSTTVRLIGIDSPETVSPSVPDECGGASASAAAHRMLDGARVTLTFDASQGRRDRYGRTLAYLSAPGVGDVGLAMIRRGRAAEYTYATPYDRQRSYRAAERKARRDGAPLWADCGGPDAPLRAAAPSAKPRGLMGSGGSCATGYDPCLPAGPDLDCADVPGPVRVLGSDPHRLDADGDGMACES
jgi:endonuclease YncB( thermonuclease family)